MCLFLTVITTKLLIHAQNINICDLLSFVLFVFNMVCNTFIYIYEFVDKKRKEKTKIDNICDPGAQNQS